MAEYNLFVVTFSTFKDKISSSAFTDLDSCSQGAVLARKAIISKDWDKLENAHLDFQLAALNVTAKTDPDFEKYKSDVHKKYSKANDSYTKFLTQVEEKLLLLTPKIEVPSHNTSVQQISNNCSEQIRVPAIDIDDFYGSYEAWPSFRDMFTAIFKTSKTMSDVQKLHHLRRKTKQDAARIVHKFSVESKNFDLAWKALVDQYENKRFLVNIHIKTLLTISPLTIESVLGLKSLYEAVNDARDALRSYDIEILHWDPVIVYIVFQNLPSHTRGLFEQNLTNHREIPTWSVLEQFLKSRVLTLEAIDEEKTNKSKSSIASKPSKPNTVHVFNTTSKTNTNISCPICKGKHVIRQCSKFLEKSIRERQKLVIQNNLCVNCFASNHALHKCMSKFNCYECGRRHHTLLHMASTKPKDFIQNQQNQSGLSPNAQSFSAGHTHVIKQPVASETSNSFHTIDIEHDPNVIVPKKSVILATALVKISSNNCTQIVRALVDPGSEATFLSESAFQRLRIKSKAAAIRIIGMNSAEGGLAKKSCSFIISSVVDPTVHITADSLVLPKLTGILPKQHIDLSLIDEIRSLQLADHTLNKPGKVELVIGADLYSQILLEGVKKYNQFIAQNSVFGWLVSGVAATHSNSYKSHSFFNGITLDKQIEKFWETEEVFESKPLSWEDHYCEKLYNETTYRNRDGTYTVQLPFKSNFPEHVFLGSSRNIALKQFLSLEKSLLKKEELKKIYDEVVKEYLTLGHMSPIDSLEKINADSPYKFDSFYLPHRGVLKPESLSTKLRVVFNASSASINGFSLNDLLYTGPTLQKDLMILILRWRKYPYVYTADIMKMYRQIRVHPKHADYQRILFRKSTYDSIKDYRLETVTFGVNCAPYLAIRTLMKLADDEIKKFPMASDVLKNDFYVDDVLSGGYDISSVIEVEKQLMNLLKSGGFALKKWSANNCELLQPIPVEDRITEEFLSLNCDNTLKALGIYWKNNEDVFTFKFQKFSNNPPFTKRKIFSNIAKLFDPAGWLSPVVVIAKIILQNIWKDKTDWDDVVEPVRLSEWHNFYSDLPNIAKIKIPRWLNYHPTYEAQFHGFCDASQSAIAAAIYLRIVDSTGHVSTNLVSSKTKVAPVKTISIPRLELSAAVLLSKLLKSIMDGLKLENYKFFLWTDSTIVLAWLKKSPNKWKTFIANRVTKVLNAVGDVQWRHIRSEHNPADLASRGIPVSALISNSLWWHGPEWINDPEDHWPQLTPSPIVDDIEEATILSFTIRTVDKENVIENEILKRFSSYSKALHVIGYIYRFYNNSLSGLRNTSRSDTLNLSQKELNDSKLCLIRLTQKHYYNTEYTQLAANHSIAQKSSLLALNPFLDKNNIIRANGRLAYSSFSYSEKYPIILPSNSYLIRLLVDHIHKITLHGGNSLMLSLLRREFWIPRIQGVIRSHIYNCNICVIQRKQMRSQIMSALPHARVHLESPFAFRNNVGLDFAGPITLKNKKGRFAPSQTSKGYVCLFICFTTKAVHLEAVSDLTSDSFLAAFDRFVSRRGLCCHLYSDNGTNFVGADRLLKVKYKKAVQDGSEHIAKIYSTRGLTWHFIPPGTPHYGGLWEAGVKSMKHHLRRVTKSYIFTFEELATILAKIEACLNSRPLTPISSDPTDPTCLTPGHFLIGDSLLSTPEIDFVKVPTNSLKRWQLIQQLQQIICRRWKEEYISQLHQRPKWRSAKENVKVGDMVVLKRENLPPTEWRLGRIIKIHPGQDTKVRMATIMTQYGDVVRHVAKLCVLPMETSIVQPTN